MAAAAAAEVTAKATVELPLTATGQLTLPVPEVVFSTPRLAPTAGRLACVTDCSVHVVLGTTAAATVGGRICVEIRFSTNDPLMLVDPAGMEWTTNFKYAVLASPAALPEASTVLAP